MVGEAFYWVLNMSLTAGLTGLVVWLIGRIPRLPRRVAAVLWVIPGLRLLIPVALGIACLHWFNPLVWLFLKRLYADLELACDERVTGGLEAESRRTCILSYRRLSWGVALRFGTLVGVMAWVLLTNSV